MNWVNLTTKKTYQLIYEDNMVMYQTSHMIGISSKVCQILILNFLEQPSLMINVQEWIEVRCNT